ncbi:MAG: DNA recombination protein RmuC [Clostridia bacterium]|nr:DNA recombination protein RmuC [Clostridia bacterium]MDD4386590.1 DNA recombination protein RmuC [Clostridia bacterium]
MDITIILLSISIVLLIILIILNLKNQKSSLSHEFRQELSNMFMQTREEISRNIGNKIVETTNIQQVSLANLTNMNENKLENIRKSVEDRLTQIQKDNSEKLEKMRLTVDEKLHNTLEQRLGESFKLVNDRLESVYKGLGEMKTLAQGVGDLKKVFTNVKSRGFWGEIQLGNILDQFLTNDQYLRSVKTKPKSNDFVEFAIKLPGRNDNETVLLPIDSKFPIEDYTRLVDAEEVGDVNLVNESRKKLENSVKLFAKDIHDKYIETPYTTDFGIMFLPTESLYCEIVKNTDLCQIISQKFRVVIAGPSTFVALLNSLQMGFRTLAIEKRSSEVWQLLGMVKSEFSKFGDLLDKTNKKLQEISSTMELASKKTRTIQNKLKKVEVLPIGNESEFYMLDNSEIEEDFNSDVDLDKDKDKE